MLFLAQYTQTEYGQGYALVALFLVLGLLLICVPRPRRADFIDPEEERRLQAERVRKKQLRKASRKKKKKKKKPKKA